jgi:hypothetical protein
LNEAAHVAGSHNEFELSFLPNTSQLRIRAKKGDDIFGFLFGSGNYIDMVDQTSRTVLKVASPALIFGFPSGVNALSDSDGLLVAPNYLDLGLLTNRIYLSFNYDTTQNLQAYTRGNGRRSPSAIIHMDEVRENRKFLNKETYIPLIVSKNTPVSKIQQLDIHFEHLFGGDVNFGNREVSLIIEAVCLY